MNTKTNTPTAPYTSLVGQKAPNFTSQAILGNGDIQNEYNTFTATKGKKTVLFFYPLNFTIFGVYSKYAPSLKIALEQIAALQRSQEAAAAMQAAERDVDMASSIASSIGPSASAVAESIARRDMDVDLTDYNVVLRRPAASTAGSSSAAPPAAPPATVPEAIREIDEVVTEMLTGQDAQSTVTAMEYTKVTGEEE